MSPEYPSIIYFDRKWQKSDLVDQCLTEHSNHFEKGISHEVRAFEHQGDTHIFKAHQQFVPLLDAAATFEMDFTFTEEDLINLSYALLEKNQLTNATVQALIYPKSGELKLILTTKKAAPFAVRENLHLFTSTTSSRLEEGLQTSVSGNLICKPESPFFFIKDGILYTPGMESTNSPSVVRDSIIECAIALGCPVIEKSISVDEIEGCEAAFYSNYSNALNLVTQVDDYVLTQDWRSTIALDLFLMFRQQATNEDFQNQSII